jgi:hypothetical protein
MIASDLTANRIPRSVFREPDLDNILTAVCFICDERVWDHENYPNFTDYIIKSTGDISSQGIVELRITPEEELKLTYKGHYEAWTYMMGGEKNIFLRDLIRDKRLA